MATEAVNRSAAIEIPVVEKERWDGVVEFFHSLTDLLDMYFGVGGSIARLDPKYRATLRAEEKADIDVDLMR